MLKFENTAEVGDMIRAYDFEPIPGRPEFYVTGKVIEKGPIYAPIRTGEEPRYICEGYTIVCHTDMDDDRRYGQTIYVPFEMSLTDFDNRIENISREVAC